MADLNALIAQGTQFQAPVNPFVQYGQMQQLQQNEQANQLNQMKMQEYQRGMEETNAMRRLDPNSPSYLADITRINPEKGFAFGKMRQEAKTAGTEGQIKDTKLLADKLALLTEAYRLADDPEKYLALHQAVHADPVVGPYLKSLGATPEKGMATLQNAVQTGKFNELRMGSMQSVSQLLDSMKPLTVAASSSVYNPQTKTFTQAPAAPATPVKNIANVNPGDFTPASVQRFTTSGNYADLIPKPTRVAGDGTGVAKAPAGYRVTANGNLEAIPGGPAASKPMTDLQIYKLRTDVAKDYKVATDTLSKMDDLLESIDKVKTAPGLAGATGYLGKLPSFSEGASAQAESRLANLRGKVTALGKATAAMSGSIGSIANQEWKILADQVAVLDEVKGVGPLLDQISLVESQAKGAIDRIRDGYEKTRSEDFERFPQFRDLPASKKLGGTPAAPTGTGGFKYLGKEGQ